MYIFTYIYEVMEFLKNVHGKSWESHGISFLDLTKGNVSSVKKGSSIFGCDESIVRQFWISSFLSLHITQKLTR